METNSGRSHVLSLIGAGGTSVFLGAMLVLHFLQPSLNPWTEAMSYYVHGSRGWLLTVGLLGLGISSLALWIAMNTSCPTSSKAGRWCFGIWTIGVLLGSVFPADPPGQWSQPPSPQGAIHGIAAVIALPIFPFAALLLSASWRRIDGWKRNTVRLRTLALFCLIALVLFFVSLAPVFLRPGPPILLGLTERILLGADAAWLLLLSHTLRPCRVSWQGCASR